MSHLLVAGWGLDGCLLVGFCGLVRHGLTIWRRLPR